MSGSVVHVARERSQGYKCEDDPYHPLLNQLNSPMVYRIQGIRTWRAFLFLSYRDKALECVPIKSSGY